MIFKVRMKELRQENKHAFRMKTMRLITSITNSLFYINGNILNLLSLFFFFFFPTTFVPLSSTELFLAYLLFTVRTKTPVERPLTFAETGFRPELQDSYTHLFEL